MLVISSLYPPHSVGGYELTCHDVVERWRRAGHDVTVLTSDTRLGDDDGDDPDVWRTLRLFLPPVGEPLRRRSALRADIANNLELSRMLSRVRPDVVSVWHMGGLGLSMLRRLRRRATPTVFVVCDPWMVYAPEGDPAVQLFGAHVVPDLGAIGAGVFCSAWLRDHVETKTRWRFRDPEIAWLGVDPEVFPVQVPSGGDWRWRLLYVGRVDEVKGVETVIRALAQLPEEATLDIIGHGRPEYLRHLQHVVDGEGLADRVHFGVADRARLVEWYRAADALVFPSDWPEPFGIVPLEAMACGTPVVATGTGGSGEYLVHEQNCLLFAPGDSAALVDTLQRLARDGALRSKIARDGSEAASTITVDRLAERLEEAHCAQIAARA